MRHEGQHLGNDDGIIQRQLFHVGLADEGEPDAFLGVEVPLHGKRLPDDASGSLAEAGPVGSKLKLERDPGDHARTKPKPKTLIQKRAASFATVSPLRPMVFNTTIRSPNPIVSCGNR